MDAIGTGLVAEFSDLSLVQAAQLAVRLLVAAALGGLHGWERARAGKSAGLRTHILVAVGAAGFVAVAQQGLPEASLGHAIQGLMTGIGFLGAGCILKTDNDSQIQGLTTAAGLWLTAAVGAAAGLGREASAVLIGLTGFLVLTALYRFEPAPDPAKAGNGPPPGQTADRTRTG